MLSPLAGAMKRHTSSRPSGVSHFSARPRCTAKQSASSSSGPTELVPAFVRVDPQLDGRGDPAQQLLVEDEEARIGRPIVVEVVVDHRRALAAEQLAAVDLQLAGGHELRVATDVSHIFLRRGARLRTGRTPHGDQQGERHQRTQPELLPQGIAAPQVRKSLVIRRVKACLSAWLFRAAIATTRIAASAHRRWIVTSQSTTNSSMRAMSASDKPK